MTSTSQIAIARVTDAPDPRQGARLLVDRLWPRGLRKDKLHLDDWIRDVAPTTRLRRWFGHDPAKWDTFRKLYREELDTNPNAVKRCLTWHDLRRVRPFWRRPCVPLHGSDLLESRARGERCPTASARNLPIPRTSGSPSGYR
ncbi:MAG: DUF488 domain-containing protein [Alphaproteobacteria bacterium]